ncbi:MAG: Do/DeqQ family serine protease [Porticoccus sp.]|jgi:Do/DeqQ family serine protease
MSQLKRLAFFLFIVCFFSAAHAAFPLSDASGNKLPSLSSMLKQVNPAVVNIATFSTNNQAQNPLMNDPFFKRFFQNRPGQNRPESQAPRKRRQSAGSGVIVDAAKGIIVTNHHVIKNSDEVRVSLVDGREFTAEIKGVDPELDIAILHIDAKNLAEVHLGDSNKLDVGDFVVAIGNPFGLGQTVTTGIVSALGRTGLGIEGYENFIQTDASINPGNSGGALVDLNGELIGINTAIIAPSGGNVGIGFAIPVNMAKASMKQILATGEVKRGQLGVSIQDITPELREAFDLKNGQQGVLVTGVAADSEAEEAGVKAGDVITAVDGRTTSSGGQLRSQIGIKGVGDKVELSLIREGTAKKLQVGIGKQQSSTVDGQLHRLLEGMRVEPSRDNNGLIVADLEPNSRAAYTGLRSGDLIVGVNRKRVTDFNSFSEALKLSQNSILLQISRNGRPMYLVVR